MTAKRRLCFYRSLSTFVSNVIFQNKLHYNRFCHCCIFSCCCCCCFCFCFYLYLFFVLFLCCFCFCFCCRCRCFFLCESKKSWSLLVFLHFIILAKEVCYGKYGCFSNAPPFDNPSVPLPQSPPVTGVTYKLFTRDHPAAPQILDDSNATKLKASSYDGAKTTAIIIHGFNGK